MSRFVNRQACRIRLFPIEWSMLSKIATIIDNYKYERRVRKTDIEEMWSRLSLIMTELGVTTHGFARLLGMNRAETLYQIKKGNNAISIKLAKRINKLWPQYTVEWLLTGTEVPVCSHSVDIIPFYDDFSKVRPTAGDAKMSRIVVSKIMSAGADCAVKCIDYSGHLPDYLRRNALLLRFVDKESLANNELYLLSIDGRRSLFRIFGTVGRETLKLESAMSSQISATIVNIRDIDAAWRVCGMMYADADV